MHFFHVMYHSQTAERLATTEQMLLHVDMKAAAVSPIRPRVYEALAAIMDAHKDMPVPPQVGRRMAVATRAAASYEPTTWI